MKMDECILTDLTVDIGFNCYIRITYSHDDSSLIHYPQKVSGTQWLTGMTPEMDFLLPSIISVLSCLLRGPVPPLGSLNSPTSPCLNLLLSDFQLYFYI